jgi:glycosyltransferase involved in cell wall biosynthesis
MPLVSVCIPVYNGSAYLAVCLDSVLAQTFTDIEILIVDDQSTDDSFKIAQAYAERDKRIRAIKNGHNLGLVGNWNQCILLAESIWIKFLFQDDLLEPNCIEKMLEVCGKHTKMVVCKRNIIYQDNSNELRNKFSEFIKNNNMDKMFPDTKEISPESFCKVVLNNLVNNFVGEPTSVLLKRNVFNYYGLFNRYLISICDMEYWIRVGSHTGLVYIPEALVHFRRHRKGTSFADEQSRKFRMHIDNLVCINEFLFNPLYERLRFYALQCRPPVKLDEILAVQVKSAWKIARKAARDNFNPDTRLLDVMNEITILFPGFNIVRKIPFSRTCNMFKYKVKDFFKKFI